MKMAKKNRCAFRDGEKGFAMVMVLFSVTLLTIIGALALIISVSSLQAAVNMKPEDRAFQIAEDGLSIAHARLTDNLVNTNPYAFDGTSQGGDFSVTITGTTPYFNIVSSASYTSGGATYRRKLSENVTWYGDQAFDAMRNYLFYAHHNINISVGQLLRAGVPITFNGNMRATNMVNGNLAAAVSLLGGGFTINGKVEGMNGVDLSCEAQLLNLGCEMHINDDIKTNGTATLRAPGGLLILLSAHLYAQNVYAAAISRQGNGVHIDGSQVAPWSNLQPVYEPRPTFEYFRALAKQQNHYYQGDMTFGDTNMGDLENSSTTVIYCTGDLTLSNFNMERPNMKGVFICEGNFYTSRNIRVSEGCKFQVVTKGNAYFDNTWDYGGKGQTDEFFIWSGHDTNIDLGMFAGIKLQVTSMNDINVSDRHMASQCVVNYGAPDIDIGGYPIGVAVRDWKELPSE